MNLSPTAQATLLLTSYFSKANSKDAKPLTNTEWGKFASWLKDKSKTPADLLAPEPKSLLNGWQDSRISTDRILQLLNRGHSLALAVEKWQRAGLWVVTRSDPEYPKRLKQRLKTESPPVLFGCGNKTLLNARGLAVIGSRNAGEADLYYTEQVGAKAASEGITIVSGGARGVDGAAMLGAMRSGGSVLGVMVDSLLKAAISTKWCKGLMDGNLVLVSPLYPEAGFSVGNAMARNKYIYCLADTSLVICSGKKGGTISGAEENLNKSWIPLWVKPTHDDRTANADLVAKGGRWCEADIQSFKVSDLLIMENRTTSQIKAEQVDSPSVPDQGELLLEGAKLKAGVEQAQEVEAVIEQDESPVLLEEKTEGVQVSTKPVNFYQLFIGELRRFATTPITQEKLLEGIGVRKSQLNAWLKQAIEDGIIEKLNRPVRYQIKKNK